MKRIIFGLLAFILVLVPSYYILDNSQKAKAAGVTYYVDATGGLDTNDGLSEGAAWKTIAKVATQALNAGDQVLFKRGETWAEQLTPGYSGSSGNPIIYGAYGSGQSPIIAGGAFSIRITSQQYLQFNYLILKNSIRVATANEITLNYCIVYGSGTSNGGTYADATTNYRINNSVFASNYMAGIWGNGATTTIYLKNSIVTGNGLNGYSGLKISSGATINYNHNLITGNSYFPRGNIGSDATIIDQGNNLKEYFPGIISPKVNSAYFIITSDDATTSYWLDLGDALAPYNVHLTAFTNTTSGPPNEEFAAILQHLIAEGQEIGNHTWGHSDMSSTQAFSITSTNTNPTINVDMANSQLIFSCDEVGNRVTIDWSVTYKTLANVKTAVDGKGWTIATLSGSDALRMGSLADSAGVQVVPYTTNLDISAPNYPFFREEISDENDVIFNATGYRPITMSYPWALSTAWLRTYLKDVLGLAGAAGVEGTSSKSLASINIFNAWRVGADFVDWGIGTGTEEDVRETARHVYAFAKEQGIFYAVLSHQAAQFSVDQMTWYVDELVKCGATFKTFGEAIDEIKTTHSTADGFTYTKTYPDVANYNLLYTSPCIDAGADVSLTRDSLGNSIYGTPDCGAFEYQPPHTMGANEMDVSAEARVYGDGKFRDKSTTSGTTADLNITPESGTFPIYGADEVRPEWMDITDLTWNNTGTHHKNWTESSTAAGLTNTVHTVGDLENDKYYNITVDSHAANLTGTGCAVINDKLSCKSNGNGKISFTYTGTYTTHVFDVEEGDNIGPTINSVNLTEGQVIGGNYTIFVNATDSLSGMQKVEFYIDNELKSTATSTPYQYDWDTTQYHSPHVVKIIAYDQANNTTENTYNVQVVNQLPDTGSVWDNIKDNLNKQDKYTIPILISIILLISVLIIIRSKKLSQQKNGGMARE
jgi:peptidoglycan/xylan/chitin deacetylase (PgdA/CDA1 family)